MLEQTMWIIPIKTTNRSKIIRLNKEIHQLMGEIDQLKSLLKWKHDRIRELQNQINVKEMEARQLIVKQSIVKNPNTR